MDLQDIPKEKKDINQPGLLKEIPLEQGKNAEIDDILKTKHEVESTIKQDEPEILQEIPPKPFESSLITFRKPLPKPLPRSNNIISDAFKDLKQSFFEEEAKEYKPKLTPISKDEQESESALLKRRKLEKDMTEVLSFLSRKISVKKLEVPKPIVKKEPTKKIPPTSMNEILKELVNLDSNIEASAILKTDGEILASAISNRISDSLFATIGMNLSMIGTDIIEGLSAGILKSISIQGSNGVLSLAPIDKKNPSLKDMILILFSDPKIKSGIISFAVHVVKKQVTEYLGFEKK